MNEKQLASLIRQGFALNNVATKAVADVDRVLASAMKTIKTLVGLLPQEGLLRDKSWRDLEPLVRQELGKYAKQLEGTLTAALADADEGMERVAIRQARLAGADFGPEMVNFNPRVASSVETALNSVVNGKTVRKLFATQPGSPNSLMSQAFFRVVDQTVKGGIINGLTTQDIADQMAKDVKRRGIPGVDVNDAKASKQIRNQAMAMARTATQDMNRQVRDQVYDANAEALEEFEWQWSAALDSRTCETCAPLDGQTWPEKRDAPSWPVHVNCRCQVLPVDPEDDFWTGKESKRVNAQVLRPVSEGPYTGEGALKTPIKIDGKRYYQKKVPVTSDTAPARYSDVMAKWATSSNTTLEAAIGPTRARIFKREYGRMNADPQKILSWMLTGDKGAQKWIPVDKLLKKKPLTFKKGGGPPPPPAAPPKPKKPKPTPPPAPPKPKPTPAPTPAPTPTPKQSSRDYLAKNQHDNGRNKLSHDVIADSMAIVSEGTSQSAKNMTRALQFMEKKEIQTIWSTSREKLYKGDFKHWQHPDVIKSLRAGKGKGDLICKGIADDLAAGKESAFMTKICSVSSGAAGHTIEAAHMIVMRQESRFIGIKAAQLKRIKEAVQASVLEAADSKPFRTTAHLLYKRTGKTAMSTDVGWLVTYIHELGHQVHFRAGLPNIYQHMPKKLMERAAKNNVDGIAALNEVTKLTWTGSKYGATNKFEQFAETFVQYVLAPDELKKASPVAYQWVDEALTKALK